MCAICESFGIDNQDWVVSLSVWYAVLASLWLSRLPHMTKTIKCIFIYREVWSVTFPTQFEWPFGYILNSVFKLKCLISNDNTCVVSDLQPLDDVAVVLGGGQVRVFPAGVLGRQPPVQDALLHHVVGLDKQVIHLAVQVNWDGDGPALRWVRTRKISLHFFCCITI